MHLKWSPFAFCRIELCHYASELVFEVRDKDHAYTEFIGTVSVPTSTICNGEEIDQWFKILKNNKIHRGDLKLKIQYVSKVVKRHFDAKT